MRILVTGGAGFIGSNYLHWLLHAQGGLAAGCCADQGRYGLGGQPGDMEVLNLDCLTYAALPGNVVGLTGAKGYTFSKADICDAAAVGEAFRKFRPEAVVHFAAESHVDRSIEDGSAFVRTNVLGTQVLLDAARRHDVGAFVHVSTDEVYGSIKSGSFKETDPLHASSPYSASKAASDLLAFSHHHTYGLKVAVTRCTNNYGPRQHPEKLLPKVIGLASQGKRLPIYGDGMNVRDWLYVKDHCTAIHHVLGLKRWGEVFNVAGRCELPNLQVVRKVLARLKQPESLVEFVKDRPGHDWRYSLDDSKLRSTGWAPKTDFEAGLTDTLKWARNAGGAA